MGKKAAEAGAGAAGNYRLAPCVPDVQNIIDYTSLYNKKDLRKVIDKNRKPVRHPYFTEYLPLQRLCLQILRREKLSFGT
ncbi:MAG: hypothetical protein LBD44_00465, partial [Spirochaetaceae bacterium]|nr:hypothetical protein [Spirochaetaceae bacterium]